MLVNRSRQRAPSLWAIQLTFLAEETDVFGGFGFLASSVIWIRSMSFSALRSSRHGRKELWLEVMVDSPNL